MTNEYTYNSSALDESENRGLRIESEHGVIFYLRIIEPPLVEIAKEKTKGWGSILQPCPESTLVADFKQLKYLESCPQLHFSA